MWGAIRDVSEGITERFLPGLYAKDGEEMKVLLSVLLFSGCQSVPLEVLCAEPLRLERLKCVDAMRECDDRLALCSGCPEGVDCD